MDALQALEILDEVTSKVNTSRANHVSLQKAVMVIKSALEGLNKGKVKEEVKKSG